MYYIQQLNNLNAVKYKQVLYTFNYIKPRKEDTAMHKIFLIQNHKDTQTSKLFHKHDSIRLEVSNHSIFVIKI